MLMLGRGRGRYHSGTGTFPEGMMMYDSLSMDNMVKEMFTPLLFIFNLPLLTNRYVYILMSICYSMTNHTTENGYLVASRPTKSHKIFRCFSDPFGLSKRTIEQTKEELELEGLSPKEVRLISSADGHGNYTEVWIKD